MLDTPRILIGGTGSGCGKTTVSLALLKALRMRGRTPAPFKCGPDFIDPMYHARVTGRPSYNLDLFLSGRDAVCRSLAAHSRDADVSVIEGVMGFYDGVGGTTAQASSADLAIRTGTPAVLVASVKGVSLSLAALLSGYQSFGENTLAGVILNGVSEAMYPFYRDLVQENTGLKVYGHLPPLGADCTLQSRHLGLIPAGELDAWDKTVQALGQAAARHLDIDGLLALAASAQPVPYAPPAEPKSAGSGTIRIAVARDDAFCFYYPDNLECLTQLGAELLFFSPLAGEGLPAGAHGLYLGGGYPELHAQTLSDNQKLLADIRRAAADGMPIVAECGGFLLLHQSITDGEGRTWPLAGVVPAKAEMGTRSGHFGYVTLRAERDTLLLGAGQTIPAHEFHYVRSGCKDYSCHAQKPLRNTGWQAVYAKERIWAGFPHVHFGGAPGAGERFVKACADYRKEKES